MIVARLLPEPLTAAWSPLPPICVWSVVTVASCLIAVSTCAALSAVAACDVPLGRSSVIVAIFSLPLLRNEVPMNGVRPERGDEDDADDRQCDHRVPQRTGDHRGVEPLQDGVPLLYRAELVLADQEGRQDGHDRQGDEERGEEREGDCQGEGTEDLADDAAHEGQG